MQLARDCKFHDCVHRSEPDCAVTAAVERGALPGARLASYRKLRKELEHLERKADPEAQANTKQRWKAIHKNLRDGRKKGWFR